MTGDAEGEGDCDVPDDTPVDFWRFSLEFYALPGVADAALTLQDNHGLDVNVAFACLFAGMILGIAIDAALLAQLVAAVEPWNVAAVRPLRQARRAIKPFAADRDCADLRRRLQALELDAERIAQNRLQAVLLSAAVARPDEASFDRGRGNLLFYASDAAQHLLSLARDGLAGEILT